MTRDEANSVLVRLLNAVTGMALAPGAVRARLARVTETIGVFAESDIPLEIRRQFAKRMRANYLSPAKATRATVLLIARRLKKTRGPRPDLTTGGVEARAGCGARVRGSHRRVAPSRSLHLLTRAK